MYKYLLGLLLTCLLFSCTKTKIVEVEKKSSWKEVPGFSGMQRYFLSSGSNGQQVFLQQPFYFSSVLPSSSSTEVKIYLADLPTDVQVRLPISPSYIAYPSGDTRLVIKDNQRPTMDQAGGTYNLKQLDPTMVRIKRDFMEMFKCMAINSEGTLLLSYENNRAENPYTFFLVGSKKLTTLPYMDTLFTRPVAIPRTSVSGTVRYLEVVGNYFLLDISQEGLFKIKADGSYTKVYGPATVDAFYPWNGRVYAHAEGNQPVSSSVLISADEGASFQTYEGLPPFLGLSSYYRVKDSLVGVYRDQLFTLRWNGTDYATRPLKSDGLEGVRINGIEVLHDSVYAATTSGLFVRSAAAFFQGK